MNTAEKIKQKGLELGYTHVGITTADDFPDYEKDLLGREDYEIWTEKDRAKYPGRTDLRAACRPRSFYPEGKSIICATWGYSQYVYPEELTPYVARATAAMRPSTGLSLSHARTALLDVLVCRGRPPWGTIGGI